MGSTLFQLLSEIANIDIQSGRGKLEITAGPIMGYRYEFMVWARFWVSRQQN
jgi:hypothetical protein